MLDGAEFSVPLHTSRLSPKGNLTWEGFITWREHGAKQVEEIELEIN